LQLLHLYLPRLPLAEAAQRWFDLDPRWATLRDRIYFQDPVLSALGRRVAALDWDDTDAGLQLQQLSLQMQSRLLLEHSGARRTAPSVPGGLSPLARRRVLQRVEDARGAELGLRELADAACLSEFHFMRMFKLSFGMTPHMWVMQRRLAHARELLAAGRLPLQQVAAQAGYAHLSHLNAALRRAGLGTAARYRNAVVALSRQAPVSAS
jgi:AraC family transcriptional regulator